ncbi:hypothetical protein QGO_3702, partial [Clostridioides difficile CD212]
LYFESNCSIYLLSPYLVFLRDNTTLNIYLLTNQLLQLLNNFSLVCIIILLRC